METLNLSGLTFNVRQTQSLDSNVHDHNFFEIFIITSGKITHKINNQTQELAVGDACIIAPFCPHSFSRNEDCIHRDTMVNRELFKECCDFYDKTLYNRLLNEKFVYFKISQHKIHLYEEYITNFTLLYDVHQKIHYEKFLTQFLIFTCLTPEQMDHCSINSFRQQVLASATNNYTQKYAIQLICKEMNFNQSYLSKKFSDTFGYTLTDHINTLRITNAAYFLSMTEYNIQKICSTVGFESLPYFIKLFKKHYGTTPAKYRKSKTTNKNNV